MHTLLCVGKSNITAYYLERAERLRRRWRLFVRVAGCVAPWHARARERAYAPGGRGFDEARADFEERAQKAQRCAES